MSTETRLLVVSSELDEWFLKWVADPTMEPNEERSWCTEWPANAEVTLFARYDNDKVNVYLVAGEFPRPSEAKPWDPHWHTPVCISPTVMGVVPGRFVK